MVAWLVSGVGIATLLFGGLFIWSAGFVIYQTEIRRSPAEPQPAHGLLKIAFGIQLALWMVLGMIANYVWDRLRSGDSFQSLSWANALLPVVVSPIVFIAIWSMWPDKRPSLVMVLISFQNGFFWQVIFSRAGSLGQGPPGPG